MSPAQKRSTGVARIQKHQRMHRNIFFCNVTNSIKNINLNLAFALQQIHSLKRQSILTMALQFAFLGVGPMGEVEPMSYIPSLCLLAKDFEQGISENLALKGKLEKQLLLWNRTHERAVEHSAKFEELTVEESLDEVAKKADVIWTCLTDETAVVPVIDRLLAHDVHGKLFVDSSTISPTFTNQVAERVIKAGAEFVAAPGKCRYDGTFYAAHDWVVFGDPSMAKTGMLTVIPAGKLESVNRILPYLEGV